MFRLFRIKGDSMLPELAGGDFVLTSRFHRRLKPGDTVVVDHSEFRIIIKRIAALAPSGERFLLCGLNKQSTSQERIGWVHESRLQGKVILTIPGSR